MFKFISLGLLLDVHVNEMARLKPILFYFIITNYLLENIIIILFLDTLRISQKVFKMLSKCYNNQFLNSLVQLCLKNGKSKRIDIDYEDVPEMIIR